MKTIYLILFLAFQTGISGIFSQTNTYTTDNSDLINDTVNVVYHDSTGGIWFGTKRGLCRLQNNTWTDYSDSLLNVNVRDIEHETTNYGKEIWVATGHGLSVLAYNVDGVTSATTYTTDTDFGNGTIIDNDVTTIAVDALHNRWAGTPGGVSVFKGDTWDTILLFLNSNNELMYFSSNPVTMIDISKSDTLAYIVTDGGGIVRLKHDVDGFSGASTWNAIRWSNFPSDNIYCVNVSGNTQSYGSDAGGYYHKSEKAKDDWDVYVVTNSPLLSNNVISTYIDDQNNIWFGTDLGLFVLTAGGWYKYTTGDGLINPVVNYITGDLDGNIWIATNSGVEWFYEIPGNMVDIDNVKSSGKDILVFPNPIIKNMYVLLNNANENTEIKLYEISGRLLINIKPENFTSKQLLIQIPVEKYNLKAGTYIVSMINGNEISSQKVVVQ